MGYDRWKMWGWFFGIGFLLTLPLFYLDYGNSENPELKKAIRVVRHVSAKRNLMRSSFMALRGDKSPDQFVKWMFSPLGTAEWYMSENSIEFSPEEMKMIERTTPLVPADVSILSNRPKADRAKQVVVKPDNQRRMIIVEAYLNPKDPPVLVKEWKFPELKN
ncbi:hypothetical protein UZ36_01230 [Candidatus Nitromaritima sp. SCGC AAA799-C22]|nr:hypothetical protein UZ36_01230 [Candidatus Nitromaritima sp. SCGC AAA799-C22]